MQPIFCTKSNNISNIITIIIIITALNVNNTEFIQYLVKVRSASNRKVSKKELRLQGNECDEK